MNIASTLRRKVRSGGRICGQAASVARSKGLRAATKYCIDTARTILHEQTAGNRIAGAQATADFDRQYNVQTTGLISMTSMTIDSPNYLYATVYKASDPDRFAEMMSRLEIRHQDFTFVDLGSGKGLTLLLASTFPFARIRGVEFARELHEAATRNIASYRNPQQRCFDVQSVHADATTYEFPTGPLVVYLYHPFEEKVMAGVVRRLEQSYSAAPRPILIVYLQPALRRLLDETTFVTPFYQREIDHIGGKALAGYALFASKEITPAEVLRG
jgi:hypothetical protein